MSASKLVNFVIAHHSFLFPSKIRNLCHRETRALFLCRRDLLLGKTRKRCERIREPQRCCKEDLEHSVTCTDRDDPVHPIILRGAGLKHGTHPELIAVGVDGLAVVELFHHTRWTSTEELIGHDDKGAIRRLQYKTDIQLDAGVTTNRLPAATAHNFARETFALK